MQNVRVLGFSLLICLSTAASVIACSTDDSSTVPGATSTTTVRINAAQGGKVTDPAGKVTLDIPAGALDADTDITLAIGAARNGAAADVMEFGPSGLKFKKPAALQVKAASLTVPDGKKASLAVEEGGKWVPITTSKVEGDGKTVSGTIEHFSSFTVVIIDGQVVIQPPASCAEAQAFTPCGGDPKGTWTFDQFCIASAKSLGSDPFDGKCPTATIDVDLKQNRQVTIDATTLQNSAGDEIVTTNYHIPLSCAVTGSDGGITTCDQLKTELFSDKPNATCADTAGTCYCTVAETNAKTASTSTYTVSGSTMTITDTDQKVTVVDFCVSGNLLLVKGKDGKSGVDFVWSLKR